MLSTKHMIPVTYIFAGITYFVGINNLILIAPLFHTTKPNLFDNVKHQYYKNK